MSMMLVLAFGLPLVPVVCTCCLSSLSLMLTGVAAGATGGAMGGTWAGAAAALTGGVVVVGGIGAPVGGVIVGKLD